MTSFLLLLVLIVCVVIERRVSGIQAAAKVLGDKANARAASYSNLYPVYTEGELRSACDRAFKHTRELDAKWKSVINSADFTAGLKSRDLNGPARESMLDACVLEAEAKSLWFIHAAMMDANLAAASGRVSREDALTAAAQRKELLPFDVRDDALRHRDRWISVIGNSGSNESTRPTTPYDNPWIDHCRSYLLYLYE